MADVRAVVTAVQADIAIDTSMIDPNVSNSPAINSPITIVMTNKAFANLGFSATHSAIF